MIIEKVSLSKNNLEEIKKIDDEFFSDENLTMDFYLNRYNEKHNGYILKDENKNVLGYLVSVPVKKELYNAIKKGVITNDLFINPQMFINKSKYNYIVSICILQEYRKKGYGKQLFETFLKDRKTGKYISLTITKEGYTLLNKYMNMMKKINNETAIFELVK